MNLRQRERESIWRVIRQNRGLFDGAVVLDVGAGKMPYRDYILQCGARQYEPLDDPTFEGHVAPHPDETTPYLTWADLRPDVRDLDVDVVVCTQVIQYVPNTQEFLCTIHDLLTSDGRLLMTGPTNWPIVERDDFWRFTVSGILRLLHRCGFPGATGGYRAAVMTVEGQNLPTGWWALGRPS